MLILTRKPGQSLYIGDHIKVTIVETKGHQIRVGIDAPRDFRIYREEIYLQIMEENKSAAKASMESEMGGLEGLGRAWRSPSSTSDDDAAARKKRLGINSPGISKLGVSPSPKGESIKREGEPQIVVKKSRSKNRDE